jgi:hypothetical protein
MSAIRRIVATAVAAGALALTVGVTQSAAAPVVKPSIAKSTVNGGGQGGWPFDK